MNASIAAAVANQRHAEMVADAESRRTVLLAREGRPHRASSRHVHTLRFRRRPFAAVYSWFAAGQL
ncbi:MAG TPA: hypothetical protein VGN35_11300 [Jatrophihabitantaceae bacterium]|jgi:hypothetical protein|nr:hypothetical protein [Jatrophihabitantaceae bacterium]